MSTVSKLQIVLEATTTAFDRGLRKAQDGLNAFAKQTDKIHAKMESFQKRHQGAFDAMQAIGAASAVGWWQEIDRLRNGKHATTRPTVNYRVYLSSNLSSPIVSALGLEITDNTPQRQGAVFTCKAKEVNKISTGIKYTLADYPTLRGFL